MTTTLDQPRTEPEEEPRDTGLYVTDAELIRRMGVPEKILTQIAILCTQHMDRDRDHRMALHAARQIANDELDREAHDR